MSSKPASMLPMTPGGQMGGGPMVLPMAPSRRSSFRIASSGDSMSKDHTTSPERSHQPGGLLVDEERKMRRRGSQLYVFTSHCTPSALELTRTTATPPPPHRPDINAIKNISSNTSALQLAPVQFQAPALEDLEAPRRQTSMDGEAIKIVIHDVDSGPICASKRHVILRRDPMDKAHRSK